MIRDIFFGILILLLGLSVYYTNLDLKTMKDVDNTLLDYAVRDVQISKQNDLIWKQQMELNKSIIERIIKLEKIPNDK